MTGKFLRAPIVRTGVVLLGLTAGLLAGCKSSQPAARSDQQIATDVQTKLHGESALSNQSIQVNVAGGVVTLSGAVSDEASRSLAGIDSGTIGGVKTVVNNLLVQPPQPVAALPNQATARPVEPVSAARNTAAKPEKRPRNQLAIQPSPMPAAMPAPAPTQQIAAAPAPPPPPPPAPPKPVIKQVTLPEGTIVPIRITETLDSKTAQTNDAFHGSLAGDLGTQGVIAIPHGAPVMGRIVEAREAAHFKGNSLLTLELTEVSAHGRKVTLVTDSFSKAGSGRGKNTAAKTGGGAAFGSIIGALAGGGKGAVIGGLAGAGAGAGVNAATRGEQTVIPSETLINFRLQSPVTLTVTVPPQGEDVSNSEPQLQRR